VGDAATLYPRVQGTWMVTFKFSVQIEADLSSSPEVGPPAVKEMVLEQVVRTMDSPTPIEFVP